MWSQSKTVNIILICLTVAIGVLSGINAATTNEVCFGGQARLTCPNKNIIMMTSAHYGQMTEGRCIKQGDPRYLGCSNDVLPLFHQMCSGRTDCSFDTSNDILDKYTNDKCPIFVLKYLELQHECLHVNYACSSQRPNKVTNQQGYLSSYVTYTKGCGTSRSPWIVSADPGQTIQLDLIDFAASSQTSNLVSCRFVYGFILERALGINHTICGGQHREGVLYTSKTNLIEIHLTKKGQGDEAQFLLGYSAVGCPELKSPAHTWYKREGNEAVIGCENSDEEWRRTCTGNTWTGEVGNCSIQVIKQDPGVLKRQSMSFQSVVIMAAIIGGAIVCSVVATVIGVVYVNKYRMRQETKRAEVVHKTYSTIGRNVEAYYRPVTLAQSVNSGTGWDMTLPPDPRDQTSSYPDQCTCATLQMRRDGNDHKTIGATSLERQSLYSSIKST